eukprot:249869-Prymnesium_polylepis.3
MPAIVSIWQVPCYLDGRATLELCARHLAIRLLSTRRDCTIVVQEVTGAESSRVDKPHMCVNADDEQERCQAGDAAIPGRCHRSTR